MKREFKLFSCLTGLFLIIYFLPLGNPKILKAIYEAFYLLQWYARQHTLGCVIPAMFIAGAISTFLSHASIMRYLGPAASRPLAYGVASMSGFILAVCSCSVLPMFASIYTMGAGLGPACAFLYSGPAINVMAAFLSVSVLGLDIGLARIVGSILFAFVIGLCMAGIFRRAEIKRQEVTMALPEPPAHKRPLWKTSFFFLSMVLFLVFSDWYSTNDYTITLQDNSHITANVRLTTRDELDIQIYNPDNSLKPDVMRIHTSSIKEMIPVPSITMTIYAMRWYLAAVMGFLVLLMTWRWFDSEERKEWMSSTWEFSKMIIPLLFGGVFLTGFVGVLIPEQLVASLVGNNSLFSNLIASVIGTMWYFATLTEIPITQTLMSLGMAKGPALALLLAGPALSVPSILVINKVLGAKKTLTFVLLVVFFSTIVGSLFGKFA